MKVSIFLIKKTLEQIGLKIIQKVIADIQFCISNLNEKISGGIFLLFNLHVKADELY